MASIRVPSPPKGTVLALEFSPESLNNDYLVAGGYDSHLRLWEVYEDGTADVISLKSMDASVLDVSWSDVRAISISNT